jgi:2-keto-4-pentenoate hydratase/2-oxohepta-3-ene-1,7-dioic acid hydratase in catechol pathway
MKIVGFKSNNSARLGIVDGDDVIDLQIADANFPGDLGEVLRRNNGDLKPLAALAKNAPSSARRPLAGLKFALPVARPGKIICLGLNYLDHVKEGPQRDNIPKFPSIFFRVLTSMVSHLQPIVRPKESIQPDYEAELVAIVGKRAKHPTLASAVDCIAGYFWHNEGSVREFQRHRRSGVWQNFDRPVVSGPGWSRPWVPPGKRSEITSRLNGKTMQSATDNMMFQLAETLVYLTKGMTLESGDVILTGTPSGVGHARKPEPVWMKAGDTCEIEIEGVGVLRNPIEDEK